jgi:hypothetical protein
LRRRPLRIITRGPYGVRKVQISLFIEFPLNEMSF